jgi:hypothetical protein
VAAEIVAKAPGIVQFNIFACKSEAYKTCEGWATGDGDAAFPTNATTRSES